MARISGWFGVRLSTFELDKKTADAGLTVLVLSVGMALFGIFLGAIWSVRTLRPLRTLAQSMEDLGHGVLHPLPVSRGDEIGQLVESFNRMAGEIEEKRKLESELAANEKVIALGRIAAGLAHEVNNPLAGMLNCLSTLRVKSNDPELVARYLPLIEKGLRKIEALVKDLLIELRVEDAHEVVDSSCLEDVRDLVAAEIDPSEIEFTWDNRLQPGDAVNRPKMQQVLLNLLRNSIQAMPTGGRLWCRFWGEKDTLVFEVEDTGHGIQPTDLGRIFDPFFTRRPTGTGLGLWIVLRLVQSMQGRSMSTAYPDEGRCSVFIFHGSRRVSRNRPENVHPILIVEDDELMRVSLEDRFRLEGFAVTTAATVDGATRELAHGPRPSLVLTDVRLPDGSGAEIFELCRNNSAGRAGHHHDGVRLGGGRGASGQGRSARLSRKAVQPRRSGRDRADDREPRRCSATITAARQRRGGGARRDHGSARAQRLGDLKDGAVSRNFPQEPCGRKCAAIISSGNDIAVYMTKTGAKPPPGVRKFVVWPW